MAETDKNNADDLGLDEISGLDEVVEDELGLGNIEGLDEIVEDELGLGNIEGLDEIVELEAFDRTLPSLEDDEQSVMPSDLEEPITGATFVGELMDDVAGGISQVAQPVTEVAADLGGSALDALVGAAQTVDAFTTAPMVRAPLTEALKEDTKENRLENFARVLGASADQFKFASETGGEVDPNVMTSDQLAFAHLVNIGMDPKYAELLAPPAGFVFDIVADPLNFIPAKTALNIVRGIKNLNVAAYEKLFLEPMAFLSETINRTQDRIPKDQILDAMKNLKGRELIFPTAFLEGKMGVKFGAAKEVAEAREAFSKQRITIPGSRKAVEEILGDLVVAQQKTARKEAFDPIINKINEKLAPKFAEVEIPISLRKDPRVDKVRIGPPTIGDELSIADIDEIIDNLDPDLFTPVTDLFTSKAMSKLIGRPLLKARADANDALKAIPAGMVFRDFKKRASRLLAAQKEGSGIRTIGQFMAGGMAGGMSGIGGVDDPIKIAKIVGGTALATRFMTPAMWYEIVGISKLPKDAVELLNHQFMKVKGIGPMYEALIMSAAAYPKATERLIRGVWLKSGKPEGQDNIDPRDLASMQVTDPVQIARRIKDIENDEELSTIEKAKEISRINKYKAFSAATLLKTENKNIEPEKPKKPKFDNVSDMAEMLRIFPE